VVPIVIFEPVFMEGVGMVEGIDCPALELPPMAKAWAAMVSAAMTAMVVNVFI
jgi:hypothetical protein